MSNEPRELKIGDKVRWKQMPSAIAVVCKNDYGNLSIKFETDGPLKGQTLSVSRASLLEVTILDEIAIEGTETADPWFRGQAQTPEDVMRRHIEAERRKEKENADPSSF